MGIRPVLSPVEEHVRSLQIATAGSPPVAFPVLATDARVLDVGCGAGQTLLSAYPRHVGFGLDPDVRALRVGTVHCPRFHFVCGIGESLPFRSGTFDAVIASVSLPYMDVRAALAEIRRVLKPGGVLWTLLHPMGIPWRQACSTRTLNGWLHFAYVVANTACFHLTGRQFRVCGRCESFQTVGGIRRALRRHHFKEVSTSRGELFVVQARAA
jgi:SAM-dependent methyltransferase